MAGRPHHRGHVPVSGDNSASVTQIIDPFVEVEIIGLPVDCSKEQTRVVDDNGEPGRRASVSSRALAGLQRSVKFGQMHCSVKCTKKDKIFYYHILYIPFAACSVLDTFNCRPPLGTLFWVGIFSSSLIAVFSVLKTVLFSVVLSTHCMGLEFNSQPVCS